jgi:glycyl-tRNA synthetase beta chain
MPELLIELFCEEIPARMQRAAAQDFLRLMTEACAAEGLVLEGAAAHHGPRRITLVAEAPAATEAVRDEKRGPAVSAPEAARTGFIRSVGGPVELVAEVSAAVAANSTFPFVSSVSASPGLFVAVPAKREPYIGAQIERPGRAAAEVIGAALPAVLRKLPWPKSMRWGGAGDFTFARPLRRVLCIFDGAVVPVPDLPAGLAAGDLTEGHRFLHPGTIRVSSRAHYVARLRDACVIVDAEERKHLISEGAARVASEAGLRVVDDAGLLDEVTGLVEWPCPLLGRIDAQFMDLPPEVLRTSMRVNQRYFACVRPDGSPAPHFVVIANVPGSDRGAAIVAGNERVLRARFSDARFFWDQDRKVPLEAFLPRLESVTFHAKLGTQAQRVARLEVLAERIAPLVGADATLARRAARLCKADLATGMVGEFPELQGVMGSYYARLRSEDAAVADAVRDHYAPRGPSDAVPSAPVTVALALADKLDQLAGFFSVGEKPTGSGDPFGLRRAALGVIRLVRENGLRLDVAATIEPSLRMLARQEMLARASQARAAARALTELTGDEASTAVSGGFPALQSVPPDLLDFLADRLRVQLRAEGKRHDILSAILAKGTDPDLLLLLARAEALEAMLATDDGLNLLAGYKRATNILRIEEKRDGAAFPGTIDPACLTDPAEQALAAALATAQPRITEALAAEDFAGAMAAMASLRHPIDTFFDQVTVNAPETTLRQNRLNLLAQLRSTFSQVADFSKIEG